MSEGLWQAGKLERHIKSEEAPASNDGPVKVVTANTFDKITSGQNVLLEFYAPWYEPAPAAPLVCSSSSTAQSRSKLTGGDMQVWALQEPGTHL